MKIHVEDVFGGATVLGYVIVNVILNISTRDIAELVVHGAITMISGYITGIIMRKIHSHIRLKIKKLKQKRKKNQEKNEEI